MPFPRCIKCVDTHAQEIRDLEISMFASAGHNKKFISVRNYFKSPVIHSRQNPLPISFIEADHSGIKVHLDTDSHAYTVLRGLQAKCIQASPDPSHTQGFILVDENGTPPEMRLKTQYTKWKNEQGQSISRVEALAGRGLLLAWCIEMYRQWRQRDGTWHTVWALNSARVGPLPEPDTTSAADNEDWESYV